MRPFRARLAHAIFFSVCSLGLFGGCERGSRGDIGNAGAGEFRRVRNGGNGIWAPHEVWRLTHVSTIGQPQADGPEMFGQIVDVAVDPLGRIWVADAMAHEIRVFNEDGEHVRSFGQQGGGPKEFSQIAGMDWGPDGNLWIQDPGNSRWAVYDTAATLIRTAPRAAGVSMVPWPGGFDRDGRLYDVVPVPDPGGGIAHGIVRYDRNLEPEDTFHIPPFAGEFYESVTGDERNRSINRIAVPFTGSQVWRLDKEGFVWTTVTDRYQLVRHRFSGDTVQMVELKHSRAPVSKEDVDLELANYRSFIQQGGRVDRSRIPRFKPATVSFFVDLDGALWVLPSYRNGEPPALDVFDSKGEYLGRVTTPNVLSAVPAPAFRDDLLAAVSQDEHGVASVMVLRIEKPGN